MSRRHQHNTQPYDYDRFVDHSRDRDRDRNREQARAIEYQDDSLSSINSDEDSYLHHQHKDKKSSFYIPKLDSGSKSTKLEKPSNSESYHPKEMPKSQFTAPPGTPDPTSNRLTRIETLLEQLITRNPPSQPIVETIITAKDKATSEKRGQFSLEPRRHNFTTSMWINKIQDVSIENNWDEKTTVSYMGSQMSGIIKAWYNNLPSYDYTWPEWKILISKMFPDNTDFVTSMKRLVTRLKQAEESLTTYYFSKMYLIECCKVTGEDAVSCLIDGLNNQTIQEQAKAQNFLTPETLYSQFLMVLSEYTVDYPPAVASFSDPPLSAWYYQSVNETPKAEIAAPDEPFEYEKPPHEEFDFCPPPPNQFHDHKPSQPTRQVPVHKRLDKRFMRPKLFKVKCPMAARVCNICQKRGHLARQCFNKPQKVKCCKTRDHADCYYKRCTVNGYPLDGFVDTGCTTVTVREEAAKVLGLRVGQSSVRIQTYGGGSVGVLGEAEFELGVDAVRARVTGVIVPDHVQDTPVVVGQEFLNQGHVCAVLHNETLNIFKASHKLTQ